MAARQHPPRPPIAVIGAGQLARALVPLLRRAGYRVSLARSRGPASPRRAIAGARLVLLAVADRALSDVARRLAADPTIDWSGRVVLHHAGALGLEPLASLARRGASVGLLHPLQCLGAPELAARIVPGSRTRIEGDRRGRAAARRVARDLGLVPLRFARDLGARERAAYHTAAALVSNDLLALLAAAVDLLERAGLDRDTALQALGALAAGTLRQALARGLGGALTGPVIRGDAETLDAHLRCLGGHSRAMREVHRLLSLELARLARRHGIDVAAIERRLRGRARRVPGPAAGRRL